MQLRNNIKNRGDTLIEVLFAITVFSLVVVGALSIMNQGTESAQRALEITLVRQEIDAQAETLRFLNASYIDSSTSAQGQQWATISSNTAASVSTFGAGTACSTTAPARSFVLNTKNATYKSITGAGGAYRLAPTYSQIRYNAGGQISNADGIWIEAVKTHVSSNNQDTANYIDFHIRACWDSPGQSVPVTLGTIVRLYEPV